MNNNTTVRTFQQIPCNITGSIQSTYLYSKLCMLEGKWYSQKHLGTNPINREVEITKKYVSQYTRELESLGFLKIEKEEVQGSRERNIYHITLASETWIPVYNDFINLTTLNAAEKGFAIRLACLKEMPKTQKEIADIIGVSLPTCRKYIRVLEENNILNEKQLNETYFPNLKKEVWKNKYFAYKKQLRELTGNPRIQKKIDWLEQFEEQMPYKWMHNKLEDIEIRRWGREEIKKELKHLANIKL